MRNILIYTSLGAEVRCVKDTCYFLRRFVNPDKYEIRYVHYWDLIDELWESNAELIVFPGGADREYQKKLGKAGCDKIRNFIESGGNYLGICAGAYFAGSYLEFAKGTDLEIIEKRSLALFDGTTLGPILKPFSYEDNSGACAAKIDFGGNEIYVYYNGGGTFIPSSGVDLNNIEVIATYAEQDNLPAIIKCYVGKGTAILSGVHFEKSVIHDGEIAEKVNQTAVGLNVELEKLFNFLLSD